MEYYVHVEELIPRFNVSYMLTLAENVEALEPVESKIAFKDLKRMMAWMEKYISPTIEFWEWRKDTFHLDAETTLTVQLLGFGWAVAIGSRKAVPDNQISAEEKRLVGTLDKLTGHIPIDAILRVKSTRWTRAELKEAAQMLSLHGVECMARKTSLEFKHLDLGLDVEPAERLRCSCVSRETAKQVEGVLELLKEYADRRHEGAGWCAYQRRRLTLVHKVGSEKINATDVRFLTHPEYGMEVEIMTSHVTSPSGFSAGFYFPRAKYHLGNIHPRALIAVKKQTDSLRRFSTYVYYLWNFHYSRVWLYLLFEDIYSFAYGLRSSHDYIDPKIREYWDSLLKTDEIITEMETLERIDKGEFRSYNPPHDDFNEVAMEGSEGSKLPVNWLRTTLIEATTTELHQDPLKSALTILKEIDASMKNTLHLFVRTVDIRIQKTLHVLQFLFIVVAVGEAVHLLDLGPLVVEVLKHFGLEIPLIEPVPASLVELFVIIIASAIVMTILRAGKVRHWIERIIK